MQLRRYGTFTGGIDLPDEKRITEALPIRPCPRLTRLRVPLAPCGGAAAEPIVPVGRQVLAGEKLAAAPGPDGVDIFAPLAGRVVGLTQVDAAANGAFVTGPAIELADLAETQAIHEMVPTFDWRAASAETLCMRMGEAGLMVYGRRPQPLLRFVQRARAKACGLLVANVMEGQPYVTADHRLLVEHGVEVIRGLHLLAQVMKIGQIVLAADQRYTDRYRQLVGPARSYGINRVALPHKYPVGAPAMLTKILARRELPPGGTTMDVGVAMVDAATCFAAYRGVACDLPPTARVVTLAGERIERPGNYWVPLGAGCVELTDGAGPPVIHGGPMVGLRCDDEAVVGPGTDAVLAVEAAPVKPPSPCIRCGWCTDHCPARLNVAALNDAFELGRIDHAHRGLCVTACVECGVCTYICPARLPLSQRVKQLKYAHADRAGADASETETRKAAP